MILCYFEIPDNYLSLFCGVRFPLYVYGKSKVGGCEKLERYRAAVGTPGVTDPRQSSSDGQKREFFAG